MAREVFHFWSFGGGGVTGDEHLECGVCFLVCVCVCVCVCWDFVFEFLIFSQKSLKNGDVVLQRIDGDLLQQLGISISLSLSLSLFLSRFCIPLQLT